MKNNIVCAFDFETIANPEMIELLPEVEPKANLKDPEKIKADIESKKIKQIEDMALNPHTNIICCASFQDVYTGARKTFLLDESGERVLLINIWDHLANFQTFTTFNGISFDIECLKFHSMLHDVRPTVHISQDKYKTGNHIDLRMVLGRNNDFAKGSLDYFSKIIFKKEKEISGKEVQKLWDEREYQKIIKHCEEDVDLTANLYKKLEGYYI